ncbi:hypothetical protein D7D25_11330 [Proteiniphilum sp. X52]|nr:hypothetical protein D7D25_11330 [Proteiniphilum sp. X52]
MVIVLNSGSQYSGHQKTICYCKTIGSVVIENKYAGNLFEIIPPLEMNVRIKSREFDGCDDLLLNAPGKSG